VPGGARNPSPQSRIHGRADLEPSSAPAGDYVVEYKLHDVASDKTASFQMPFKIAS